MIAVEDARIRTATVEIKTLAVSGRQVTMGLFRQLIEEAIIDPDTADLRGIPWGTVNYHPAPCRPDHLHVVWQKGDELRRSCVYERKHLGTIGEPLPDQWELQRQIDRLLNDLEAENRSDEDLRRLREKYDQRYAELAALEQLFIAV